jgi:hypothetical protein
MLAQQVHRSLEMIDHYREPRLKSLPKVWSLICTTQLEWIRRNIFKLYDLCGGKAKDKFKAIGQMYNQVMKDRKEICVSLQKI